MRASTLGCGFCTGAAQWEKEFGIDSEWQNRKEEKIGRQDFTF